MSSVSTPTTTPSDTADVALDLRALAAALWARRLFVIVPTLVALIGSAAYVNLVAPRYTAETRLVIENRETPLTRPGGEQRTPETPQPLDQEAIQSQVQIIYSRDIARSVIRDLNLTQYPEFDPLAEGRSPLSVVLSLIGLTRDLSQMTAEDRALEAYNERLAAYPVERSRVIEIRFTSRDPDLAARVANAIAERFIETQIRAKLDRDRRAREHMQRTIDELRRTVAAAEERVQEHRARYDLLTGTTNQTLGVQSLTELNTQISTAQAQRADAQARANAIRDTLRGNRPIEASEVLNSPAVQRLADQRAQLRAEQAQASTVMLPGHPRMRELAAQLADNETQTRAVAERIARGLENDARIAGERLASLQRALSEQAQRTASQGDQEVILRGLEREARAQRDLLENWLGLHRESAARDSIDARAADARIVSHAVPASTPSWPRKLPTILIFTLSTLVGTLGLVLTAELISGRAFVGRSVVAVPVAAPVAAVRQEPELPGGPQGGVPAPVVAAPPREPSWEPTARAKADDLAAARDRRARRIIVSSAEPGAGADVFALALARALARPGRRVVLIDADVSRPSIAEASGLGAVPGLGDMLAGNAGAGAVIHADPGSRAHLLPAGMIADLAPTAIEDTKAGLLLVALDAAYQHVVVLAPPIVEGEVAAGLAAKADLVLLAAPTTDDRLSRIAVAELTGEAVVEIVTRTLDPDEEAPRLRAAA
jgi:succinoglycan biosynthesis transport protein ExoP